VPASCLREPPSKWKPPELLELGGQRTPKRQPPLLEPPNPPDEPLDPPPVAPVQLPNWHVCDEPTQFWQEAAADPQAVSLLPERHVPFESQHPAQVVGSHDPVEVVASSPAATDESSPAGPVGMPGPLELEFTFVAYVPPESSPVAPPELPLPPDDPEPAKTP
jgi:hypothetical protein